MVGMQMRAQHIVDVLGCKARGGKVGEIGPILSMVALLVRALLVVARAGVDSASPYALILGWTGRLRP